MVPLLNRDIAVLFRERFPLSASSRELVAQIEAAGLDLGHEQLIPQTEIATA
jgi:hypothetical protein